MCQNLKKGIEAIRFKSDKNLIIGGFGIFGSTHYYCTHYAGKIQLFDIGVDGGNQEVAGKLVAESDEVTYGYAWGETLPVLFKEPVNITAQRWLVCWVFF